MKTSLILLTLGLMSAVSGNGAVVSYTFNAVPDLIWGTSVYGVVPQPTSAITGFLSYDTSASFTTQSATARVYNEPLPFTFGFSIGGVTIQSDNGYKIYSSIQTLSGEVVQVIQLSDNDDGTLKVNGVQVPAIDLDLVFTIHTPTPSLQLPLNINNVGTISFKHGGVTTTSASGVTYDITTLTVPEPGAGVLLGAGLIAWGLRRRR